ncbi:uncharacterized protein LOC125048160 isoform X1 [Penaeus chinensis]|uniref:uncharacterized protein LOC125048160 isoform X1 n=1 Tax=Penaeus chinensis TaxID=139456 RepID=UPI001FB65921|nr:uncharacterized protein LOC125048160 isoform X1 [Penaeus chinensis]XP_047502673.1 uncharacterized protein LOC125048160 isoform X1 [Penaeus chinensis]
MCSTDFGMLDLLFDKDDPAVKGMEGFRNTMFSSTDKLSDCADIKEEVLESGTIDWKMSSDWDADELLRAVLDEGDVSSPRLNQQTLDSIGSLSGLGNCSALATPTLQGPDDMHALDDALDDLVGLPFHAVLDSGASDSGMSSDSSLDQQLSPLSGYSMSSPGSLADVGLGLGLPSPEAALDATSDVSSTSDLGSLGSASPHSSTMLAPPCSPETILGLEDFMHSDSGISSPVPDFVNPPTVSVPTVSPPAVSSPAVCLSSVTTPIVSSPAVCLPSVSAISTAPTIFTHTPVSVRTSCATATVSAAPNTAASATPTATQQVTATTAAPILRTVTVPAGASGVSSMGGQTIVVTQANKGGAPTAQLLRSGTVLKAGTQTSRSILLPVTVKDLNQVRTIKIISTGGGGGVAGRGVRTVVSTVRPPTSSSTLNTQSIRTALLSTVRAQDSKSLLKGSGAPTVLTTSGRPSAALSAHTSPTRIKVEPEEDDGDDEDDDDIPRNSFQQLTLSDEEKRLLKKEGIQLPSHYPLTKQEERELKRIRRKIRNKISAQDSRKRKKEYIDGLEDRVKACTEENQQLQKRIRTLEAQNESLLVQMRRFQSVLTGGGNSGRSQVNASTALMMLILSAALFIVPSVRQDAAGSDSDLSLPASKMPSAGHSRSLLEAGNGGLVPGALDVLEGVDDELPADLDSPQVLALTDHDYTPVAKRQRTNAKGINYFVPPLDDIGPQNGKVDAGGGFPPDDSSGTKLAARIVDAMVEHATNNYSDPGGQHGNKAQAVVVNLGQGKKRLRDDLELE